MEPFELHRPTEVGEAMEILARHGEEAMLMAGGTDVLIQLQQEVKAPGHVVLLNRIKALEAVRMTDDGIEPIAISGASVLSSTTRADGFVIVGGDSEGFAEGA
ncbi:MAG: FAD binding domain-containing protein, partial [Nitrospinota bacterium]|nr:FAD binding domain-containing protein [Nitrospinota bacterium]